MRQVEFLDAEIAAVEQADRPAGAVVARDPAVDDGAGREPDLRGDVHRRGRGPRAALHQPQARRVSRTGPRQPTPAWQDQGEQPARKHRPNDLRHRSIKGLRRGWSGRTNRSASCGVSHALHDAGDEALEIRRSTLGSHPA